MALSKSLTLTQKYSKSPIQIATKEGSESHKYINVPKKVRYKHRCQQRYKGTNKGTKKYKGSNTELHRTSLMILRTAAVDQSISPCMGPHKLRGVQH